MKPRVASAVGQTRYIFGDCELDVLARTLRRGGRLVAVQPKVLDMLLHLIDHRDRMVSREELLDALWPGTAVTPASLSRAVQKARRAVGDDGEHQRVLRTLHGRGFQFVAESLRATDEGDAPDTTRAGARDLIEGLAQPPRRRATVGTAGPIRSLAVLPLENLSGDPEQEYFADGMTEALLGDLAKIGSLRVISRTSVMRYKQTDKSLREIAQELDVDAVIEGTVMRAGDRVRISAQLIDARNDRHLWSDRFDRELSDVLALQSDVAQAVATQIALELTPQETKRLTATRPVNPEAHDAYLRGLHHANGLSRREGAKAIELFEQAVALDPTYAQAHAALAFTYTWLGLLTLPAGEVTQKARAAALRALALDEGSALAHTALGHVLWRYDWKWEAGRRELAHAVELSPNDAWVLSVYSIYLSAVERHDDAIAVFHRAVDAAPFDSRIRAEYGARFYFARRFDRAREELLRVIDSAPDLPDAYFFLSIVDSDLGLVEESWWAHEKSQKLSGGVAPWREALWRSFRDGQSREERTRAWVAAALEHRDKVLPAEFATSYASIGENDAAFEWLERMYEKRDAMLVLLRVLPNFDPIRSDPRFQDLLRRIGFPED